MRRLAMLAALWLAACATAPPGPGWARSDLPHDPAVILGELPNGMRYLIRRNARPPGQVAMRLVIEAGSMQERAGEEGVAHLLEHMAFRGARRFPDGEIQRRLEAVGLRMGSDANATTAPDETIFRIDLTRNDATSLVTGLAVLRDIAGDLNLDPAALETERGVVLAEERMRAGPQLEMVNAEIRARVGDHPYARSPIGSREAIAGMSAASLRAFYDAYYRPERAVLVIVGDVDVAALLPVIANQFDDWKARGPAGADPAPVTVEPPGPDVVVAAIEGLSGTVVELNWFEPYVALAPTLERYRKELVETLAFSALSQRMRSLNEGAGRPAGVVTAPTPYRIEHVWNGAVASARFVGDIGGTIATLVGAYRQAMEYGITAAELDQIRQLRIDAARRDVAIDRSRLSVDRAAALASAVDDDGVFLSPSDELAIIQRETPTITLEDVNAALRQRLSDAPQLLYFAAQPPAMGEAGLRKAFASAMAAETARYAMEAVKPWPYASFGPEGAVVARRYVADLGVTFVQFANGVRLTVKQTSFEEGGVAVSVRLGRGQLGMPRDALTAADMGPTLWRTGGLAALTRSEQSRTLAGKGAYATIEMAEDAFVISSAGVTLASQLPLQLQLMAASVADPGLRTDDWDVMMREADRDEAALPFTPAGVLALSLDPLLHSGDLRWTFNTAEMRRTWKPEDAAAFIRPVIANAPIEVIVVGDIGVETAIMEVGRTFGALPRREETPEPADLRDVKFPPATSLKLTHKGRKDQAAMVIAWPAQGLLKDWQAYRAAWALGQILRDRATLRFRSDEGATYSPGVTTLFSRVLPEWGYVGFQMEIPPDRIDDAFAQVERIAADLATTEVSREELDRTIGPRIEEVKRERESSNWYWAGALAGADRDERLLDLIRTQESGYDVISPAVVKAAAQRWLKAERAVRVRVVGE